MDDVSCLEHTRENRRVGVGGERRLFGLGCWKAEGRCNRMMYTQFLFVGDDLKFDYFFIIIINNN